MARAVGSRRSRVEGLGVCGAGRAGYRTDQGGQCGPLREVRFEQSLKGEERVGHVLEYTREERNQSQGQASRKWTCGSKEDKPVQLGLGEAGQSQRR